MRTRRVAPHIDTVGTWGDGSRPEGFPRFRAAPAQEDLGGQRTPRRSPVDLEIIIPAYNEAQRLPLTLSRTVDFLEGKLWSSRVVVVDNGSDDGTVALVRSWVGTSTERVEMTLMGCAHPGKGAAVRRGLLSSTARYVGFFDADLATPLETLGVAMRHLQEGASAVIASRHLRDSSIVRPQPWSRRLGGAAFRLASRSLVDGVYDTQCGFKFFERRQVLRALVQCRSSGFAFDVELLRHLQRGGGAIVEVPVTWTDDARSTFRPFRDGVASFDAVRQIQKGHRR